jgi:hypothetical protein
MKRLIIAAVGLALVGGIIIGGMVGNPFGRTTSTSAAGVGGRLISLGTQTLSAQASYVSPFKDVSDCSQLAVMAQGSNPDFELTLAGDIRTSPDGTTPIYTSEAAVAQRSSLRVSDVWSTYGRISQPYPYVSIILVVGNGGSGTTDVTAWLWCVTSPSYAVGGVAEPPDFAAGASGMGGAYAVLGAVGGVLAITVAGTVAAKRRGGQQ